MYTCLYPSKPVIACKVFRINRCPEQPDSSSDKIRILNYTLRNRSLFPVKSGFSQLTICRPPPPPQKWPYLNERCPMF